LTSFKVDDFAAYERQTRRLLEGAIGGDRREDKPAWWRYFYLRTLSPAELTGEPDAQILELVAQGRAVGITGPSHAVICHVDGLGRQEIAQVAVHSCAAQPTPPEPPPKGSPRAELAGKRERRARPFGINGMSLRPNRTICRQSPAGFWPHPEMAKLLLAATP